MKKITLLFGLFFASQSWAQDCDALTYYTEDFETVTVPGIPACAQTSGPNNNWITVNNPGSGFESNALQYTGNAQAADAWFFTKGIAMTAGSWYKISYRYGNNSATTAEDLTVTFGTTADDTGSVFQTHAGITGGTANTYTIELFPASGTGTYYFGFHATSAAGQGNLFVDDIIIEPTTCNTPTGLTATNVLSTSATISWNETANNNNDAFSVYHYAYMTTNTTPVNAEDIKFNPTTSVSVEDLLPSTTYYLFVRTQCGPVNGDWSEGVPFTTPSCNAAAVPYTQDFESATAPGLPTCTSVSPVETGNQWTTASNPGSGFENNTLQYADSDEPANAFFFTQGIPLEAGSYYRIAYKYGNDGTTTEKLKVNLATSPNAASVISTLGDHTVTGGALVDYSIPNSFSVTETGIYYFSFNAYSDAAQGNLYVDDIVIDIWTCSTPAAITASNITTTTATVTWEAQGNPAVGYLYALNTTGETPTTQDFVAGLTKDFTELTAGTTYYFFIKGVCGAVIGDWSESITFTTPACAATTVPYSLDFEGTFVPAIPGCTLAPEAASGNDWVTANNPGSGFTSNTLVYSGTNDAANAWFYTQGIELIAGTLYKVSYKFGNNSATTTENLRVTLNNNPNAAWIVGNNFATHEAITGGTQSEDSVEFFNVPTSGIYYFGFNAYSIAGQGSIYVDDFLIEAIDCGEATNIAATNITDTTATISWEAATTGNATPSVYQYFVSTTNTPPTEGELFNPATTVDLTELLPATTYYVFVRVQCGPTFSGWETISFTTDEVAGINEHTFKGMAVYPNPVKDVLNLDATITIEKVEVYSITGQLVHSQVINNQNASINLQQLSAGAYLVNIMGEGQSKRVKIIKE